MIRTSRLAIGILFICLFALPLWAQRTIVALEVDDGADISGKIILELYPEQAPVTVENFLRYVDGNFYSGLAFHRVVEGFVIQSGGFDQNLEYRHPAYDPIINESDNGLSNVYGTIAMARSSDPDSAASQYYINLNDNTNLDNESTPGQAGYCVFGKVVVGLNLIDQISLVPTNQAYSSSHGWLGDVPQDPVLVKRAFVPEFEYNSDDFSEIPFMHVKPGDVRNYRGQGNISGSGYLQRYTSQQMLGVNCLRVETVTDTPDNSGRDNYVLMALDNSDTPWLLRVVESGEDTFKAETLDDIIPFYELNDTQSKLVLGDFTEGMVLSQSEERTDQIESIDDEFVVIKSQSEDATHWSYYTEAAGLSLYLLDESGNTSGDGWYLESEPVSIEISRCLVKRTKQLGDILTVTGFLEELPKLSQDDTSQHLSLRVGPYFTRISLDDEGWKKKNFESGDLEYKGYPDDKHMLRFTINSVRRNFTIQTSRLDLTGLADPIPIEISLGDYYAADIIPSEKCKGLSVTWLNGYADTLQLNQKQTKLRQHPRMADSDSLTIQGTLSLEDNSMDLSEQQISIIWGVFETNLSAGQLQKKRIGNIYTYRKPRAVDNPLAAATFDLDKGTFKLTISKANLSGPPAPIHFTLGIGDYQQTALWWPSQRYTPYMVSESAEVPAPMEDLEDSLDTTEDELVEELSDLYKDN